MVELIVCILFFWLFFKAVGLVLKLSWGITKFIFSSVFTLLLALFLVCLFCVGGLVLLFPLGVIALTLWLLRAMITL